MITPEEAARFNDEDDVKLLAEAEKTLDAILKKRYHTGISLTLHQVPLQKNYRLREILFDRYRAAGWKITSNSDQRENSSYYTFTAKAPHRSPVRGSLRGSDNDYIRDDGNSIGLYSPGTR